MAINAINAVSFGVRIGDTTGGSRSSPNALEGGYPVEFRFPSNENVIVKSIRSYCRTPYASQNGASNADTNYGGTQYQLGALLTRDTSFVYNERAKFNYPNGVPVPLGTNLFFGAFTSDTVALNWNHHTAIQDNLDMLCNGIWLYQASFFMASYVGGQPLELGLTVFYENVNNC